MSAARAHPTRKAARQGPVVAALGGNALSRRGEPLDVDTQRGHVARAARELAKLALDGPLVVTHGNGPQVGLLAQQSAAIAELPPTPLDVLGAESEGLIGYLLETELRRCLPEREIATLLTQTEVHARDPAFSRPTKPIGPVHPSAQAHRLREAFGWALAEEPTGGVRRVVASPEPLRIVELPTIRRLVDAGVVVVCAGGGGVPVARGADGSLEGVEAVIDKDLAAALLAQELGARALLLLTDQPVVFQDWPRAEHPLPKATPDSLRALALDPGSMGPKVEAACRFFEATGGHAAIGALEDAHALLEGRAGTTVVDSVRSSRRGSGARRVGATPDAQASSRTEIPAPGEAP